MPQLGLTWRVLAFDELRVADLYALLRLRSAVFVVEQQCVFEDMDGYDQNALHLLGGSGPERQDAEILAEAAPETESAPAAGVLPTPSLLAYARYLPPGVKYAEASIGRVVTAPAARGAGLGHQLMQQALQVVQQRWTADGVRQLRIDAQAHLQPFYRQHGFVTYGEAYMEDGIAHVHMVWQRAAG